MRIYDSRPPILASPFRTSPQLSGGPLLHLHLSVSGNSPAQLGSHRMGIQLRTAAPIFASIPNSPSVRADRGRFSFPATIRRASKRDARHSPVSRRHCKAIISSASMCFFQKVRRTPGPFPAMKRTTFATSRGKCASSPNRNFLPLDSVTRLTGPRVH